MAPLYDRNNIVRVQETYFPFFFAGAFFGAQLIHFPFGSSGPMTIVPGPGRTARYNAVRLERRTSTSTFPAPVVFDSSSKPFDENVSETKRAVEAVKAINPLIMVEGEIGDIGSGSELHETVPESSRILTTPEQAREFVAATGVDVLAPAVGNFGRRLTMIIMEFFAAGKSDR